MVSEFFSTFDELRDTLDEGPDAYEGGAVEMINDLRSQLATLQNDAATLTPDDIDREYQDETEH